MKICITSDGNNLEANVDQRFGRCAYFIFYDTETDSFEALANTNASGMGGVGVQNGQLMAEKGVEIVLTGNLGPNAANVLQQAGIRTVTGVCGKVKDVVEAFKKGTLKATSSASPTVSSHFGMGGKKQ
ncbi:MAG TPA: NifB/NifX family molybdenum-iron cluster-binding protein [bacterium]|nr:NifB/NifX family molybdenum-iron cluster-binding protein [bacterium]HPO51903.1 NifB/NifX family molybdenum-iron cluster-binding protein [bacterium]